MHSMQSITLSEQVIQCNLLHNKNRLCTQCNLLHCYNRPSTQCNLIISTIDNPIMQSITLLLSPCHGRAVL